MLVSIWCGNDGTVYSKTTKFMKAEITCPHCEYKQAVEVPQSRCLAFHKCEKCQQMISVPKGSENCCVICEYSDGTCPIGDKKN